MLQSCICCSLCESEYCFVVSRVWWFWVCLFQRRACLLGSQTTNRFFNYPRDIPCLPSGSSLCVPPKQSTESDRNGTRIAPAGLKFCGDCQNPSIQQSVHPFALEQRTRMYIDHPRPPFTKPALVSALQRSNLPLTCQRTLAAVTFGGYRHGG